MALKEVRRCSLDGFVFPVPKSIALQSSQIVTAIHTWRSYESLLVLLAWTSEQVGARSSTFKQTTNEQVGARSSLACSFRFLRLEAAGLARQCRNDMNEVFSQTEL